MTTNPVLAPVRHPEHSEGSVLRPITDLSLAELRSVVTALGQPPFRADQIAGWVYRSSISSFEEMTNVPKTLRSALAGRFRFLALEQEAALLSTDGETRKLALQLPDGEIVESVLMRYPQRTDGTGSERATVCVSTQVGCPVKCAFCATGLMGFSRNLSSGEILDQALHFLRWTRDHPPIVRNVVFMGMGEPLLNYENFIQAVRLLVEGVGIPWTRMTVSTAGIVPRIHDLGQEAVRPKLAISLTAANDELRSRLMPINRKWNLEKLMAAARKFPLRNREKLTFEYVLLRGVNDTRDHALETAELIRGIGAKVNLIALNPGPGVEFETPDENVVREFQQVLISSGIPAFVRKPRGRDIYAACGQLKRTVEGPS